MKQIFTDEHKGFTIDLSNAIWATDQIHKIFHKAKLAILCDVDYVAETNNELLLIEYKNYNHRNKIKENDFDPKDDKKITNVARKYFDSLNYLRAINKGIGKKKIYIYILESPLGSPRTEYGVDKLLRKRLPFLLSKNSEMNEPMIDELCVINVSGWNKKYPQYPAKILEV